MGTDHDPSGDGAGAPPLVVDAAREGATYVLRVLGELDLGTEPLLREALARAEQADAARIVVDLSELHFIDARGVHLLLEAEARSRRDGDRLTLVRGPEHVQRIFTLVGVADDLPFRA